MEFMYIKRCSCFGNWSRDIAQPGLARLTGGQKVESSNLSIPTIFMPKFRESELKLGFPFFFVHCCRFSPKVADSRRKCHISATFFATSFSRRQITRKKLIFFIWTTRIHSAGKNPKNLKFRFPAESFRFPAAKMRWLAEYLLWCYLFPIVNINQWKGNSP